MEINKASHQIWSQDILNKKIIATDDKPHCSRLLKNILGTTEGEKIYIISEKRPQPNHKRTKRKL